VIFGGGLRAVPRLKLLMMAGPVAAGLAGTFVPALRGGFGALAGWPGLWPALWLSVVTGVAATLLALTVTLLIVAGLQGTQLFRVITRLLSPMLALPHSAAALGIAFLISPSGWIARALSPWATGWTEPPDLLILNDPRGIALILGLVAKEVPFLLLMVLAALSQADAERRLMLAASLGYGRVAGWMLAVLPAVWPQIRLPVYAVLAYAITNVDMAYILGPSLPPTLAAQVVSWMMEPDLGQRAPAAAGAMVLLGLVLAALVMMRLGEGACARLGCRVAMGGRRGTGLDRMLRPLAGISGLLVVGLVGGGIAGLALWSVAGAWTFPEALPETLSSKTWARSAPDLVHAAAMTLGLALASTAAALALTLGCLEAEARFGLRQGAWALWLLWLPLIVPQVAFLPGLQVLFLRAGLTEGAAVVTAAHLVFVLPYVFLSLAPPWRAWDRRVGLAGTVLGASADRVFWRLRLPMLLRPILMAAAVGMAVSIGQYLPTLLIGGGRIITLTTEAVALSSGGNRRIIGTYAVLQLILPTLGFALALVVPAMVYRHRRGMRAGE
jgi:putative thiamine transport system permease protein